MNYPDGYNLNNGIVVSRKGGFNVSVVRCGCGREQTARPDIMKYPEYNSGLSSITLEQFGWRKLDNEWLCPYCAGIPEAVEKFFDSKT